MQRTAIGAARALGIMDNPDMVRRASKLWMPIGNRVVIIGGELVGMELAEFLHERGRRISIIDDVAQFGAGLSTARRTVMLDEMKDSGITMHPRASNMHIDADAVRFVDTAGQPIGLSADTVIIAKGAEPNLALYERLKAAGMDAHVVGDCGGVGYILGAVRSAADVAARI